MIRFQTILFKNIQIGMMSRKLQSFQPMHADQQVCLADKTGGSLWKPRSQVRFDLTFW